MFDLQEFVEACRSALDDSNPARAVQELVSKAVANPEGVREAFENFEGVERHGPISFACRDASLSVADVTTPPGLKSPAHNHQMWAVIGVYHGQEHNAFFKNEDGVLSQTGERLLEEGDVVVLASEAVHAIANPLPSISGAIHVYGGDLVERPERDVWNPHNGEREDYDINRVMAYISEMSESK